MRIEQGYISKSIQDFPFLSAYQLDEYKNAYAPCIFFGCYRYEDLRIIQQHKGLAVVMWFGQDALNFQDWGSLRNNCFRSQWGEIYHVTNHINVHLHISDKVNCKLISPMDFGSVSTQSPNGNKIYAYVPKGMPEYHGSEILNQLSTDYEIIIGDGSIPQSEWRDGRCKEFYNQSFVGLMLSPFAGGGASIIEMGLSGRRCITNVFDLPHTIPFNSIADIEAAIARESQNIGKFDSELADQVRASLDKGEFLQTEFYGE